MQREVRRAEDSTKRAEKKRRGKIGRRPERWVSKANINTTHMLTRQ